MTIRLHDTLTKQKKPLEPLEPGVVKMYHCGPTVYGYATIGNHRSFLFADVLRRYLEYRGFRVRQIMNLTDVGHFTVDDALEEGGVDKMAAAAEREGKDPWEVASFYIAAFHQDLETLGYRRADAYPRATENIPEMIRLTEELIRKRHAYVSPEGQVYFDISTFEAYGRLSGNTLENLEAGARVEVEADKRHPHDFALWKKDEKHVMQWDSPWGRGFPGWHLECSAMAMRFLGESIDIHTGGEDNLFPHHECEIAQSEGATGEPFASIWMHPRHLLVEGEKMSKSLGNVHTIPDLVARGYSGAAIRYALVSTQYRQPQNFTWDSLDAAARAVDRLNEFVRKLEGAEGVEDRAEVAEAVERSEREFVEAMDDDLNVSGGLASVFELMTAVNRAGRPLSVRDEKLVRDRMEAIDDVFGFLEREPETTYGDEADIQQLVDQRSKARANGDFRMADQIRDALRARGILIEDGASGTRWRRA
jgi:cysteinyl-tRNA synthetase